MRREPFPNCLLRGTSGLGKTLLAKILAAHFGAGFVEGRGQLSRKELASKFTKIKLHDFVIVDEAHLLKVPAQDLLMEVIDDLVITVPRPKAAKNDKAESLPEKITVPRCTIVLATDQPGALCNALRRRMADQVPLRLYRVDEVKEIAEHIAKGIGVLISPQVARHLAVVSHGLPGRVKHYLDGLRLYFPNSETDQIGLLQTKEFLASRGIDEHGLGPEEQQYLRYLGEVESAALESLGLYIGTDDQFVRRQIEPILLRKRLIKIGNGGRQLTPGGRDVVKGMAPEKDEKEDHNGDDQGW